MKKGNPKIAADLCITCFKVKTSSLSEGWPFDSRVCLKSGGGEGVNQVFISGFDMISVNIPVAKTGNADFSDIFKKLLMYSQVSRFIVSAFYLFFVSTNFAYFKGNYLL